MKNIESRLKKNSKKRLLVIYPHPDDETFNAGGLILRARSLGYEVMIVCLTCGERGKNHKRSDMRDLSEIRREELLSVGKLFGVEKVKIMEYPDGELIDDLQWTRNISRILAEFDPGVVVTYDHSGWTGHPDHIVLSVELFKMLKKKGKEAPLLLWSVWPGRVRRFMVHDDLVNIMNQPDLQLKLSPQEWYLKRKALYMHESQLGNLKDWQRWALIYGAFLTEYFAVANYKLDYDYKYVKFDI